MSFAVSPSPSMRRGPAYLQFGVEGSALIGTVAIVLSATSTEPALIFAALGVLIVGAKLLWRPGEPPILFVAFFMQWLQASLAVFRASFYGVDLATLYAGEFGAGDGIITATWLSLFGLLILAGGIRLALRGVGPAAFTELISEIRQCSLKKAFSSYCIAQLAVFGIEAVTWVNPGLAQALIALSNFKWIFFFALAVIVFVQQRGYWLLAFVCIFEVVRGFLVFLLGLQGCFPGVGDSVSHRPPEIKSTDRSRDVADHWGSSRALGRLVGHQGRLSRIPERRVRSSGNSCHAD